MEPFPRTAAAASVKPLTPPESDVFLELWKAEVRRAYAFRRALAKAETFIAGFEGDPAQDGVDDLLAEIREALLTGQPPRKPPSTALVDLALGALIPLTAFAVGALLWMHMQ
ncbi:hypothetical protein [Phenylobacterium sp.]|uniref:hypothetical protein n=1 Tax=Phenylobacterium sp. TaxID=1871053 RepID=UPI00273207F5|nr:hypothetical protein [Phenylobacterium sp.]MDP1875670.1 hypothetical protein [Phenylobacterium sp.]